LCPTTGNGTSSRCCGRLPVLNLKNDISFAFVLQRFSTGSWNFGIFVLSVGTNSNLKRLSLSTMDHTIIYMMTPSGSNSFTPFFFTTFFRILPRSVFVSTFLIPNQNSLSRMVIVFQLQVTKSTSKAKELCLLLGLLGVKAA
jgi:hypothetical protein